MQKNIHPINKSYSNKSIEYYQTSKKDPEVLFIGDSVMEQYVGRINELYKNQTGKESSLYIKGGCFLIPSSNIKQIDKKL